MHQFGWLSERGGNFFNLHQKEGLPRKGGFPQKKEGSNPGGNYGSTGGKYKEVKYRNNSFIVFGVHCSNYSK